MPLACIPDAVGPVVKPDDLRHGPRTTDRPGRWHGTTHAEVTHSLRFARPTRMWERLAPNGLLPRVQRLRIHWRPREARKYLALGPTRWSELIALVFYATSSMLRSP
jgi:hypothetical protein